MAPTNGGRDLDSVLIGPPGIDVDLRRDQRLYRMTPFLRRRAPLAGSPLQRETSLTRRASSIVRRLRPLRSFQG